MREDEWVRYSEYVHALYRQIVLARTWRYRAGRVWDRLRRQPVRPSEQYLTAELFAVGREAGKSNPFDFGPIVDG